MASVAVNTDPNLPWRSIAKPPKDDEIVLGFWLNGEMHTGCVWKKKWVPAWQEKSDWDMPQFWMPLPAAPR